MSHGTHVNESWHTCEWVMAHIWMSHGPHLNDILMHTVPDLNTLYMTHSYAWHDSIISGTTHAYMKSLESIHMYHASLHDTPYTHFKTRHTHTSRHAIHLTSRHASLHDTPYTLAHAHSYPFMYTRIYSYASCLTSRHAIHTLQRALHISIYSCVSCLIGMCRDWFICNTTDSKVAPPMAHIEMSHGTHRNESLVCVVTDSYVTRRIQKWHHSCIYPITRVYHT